MSKKMVLLLIIVFVTSVLVGCQKAPAVGSVRIVEKIELLKITEFTEVDAVILQTITAKEQLKSIVNAIKTSTKLDGILDVAMPDYGLKLYYKNSETKTYFLWVGKSDNNYHGMIMDAEDTHTGYRLTEESAELLLGLLQ